MKKNLKTILALVSFLFFIAGTVFAGQYPVTETLKPYIDNGDLPGIVTVIADRNGIIQQDCLGYANVEKKIPMTGDSLFWIASQTKPFAAVSVMMLVDEGKLDLDTSVTEYLPELNELRVAVKQDDGNTLLVPLDKPITLRNLLSHSSGMVWITPLQQRHKIDVLPLSSVITVCVMTPLQSQPGTEHSYSNMGVNVAATIVEKVSGQKYEDFLNERIFLPLGMKDTTFWPTAEQLDRLAEVYMKSEDGKSFKRTENGQLTYPLDNRETRYPEAGGGLFSTPNDLVKFYQMFLCEGEFNGKRILKPESVKEIWKKQPGQFPHAYGLCVATGGGVFGHAGSCGTESKVDTNLDLVYMYFVQHSGITKSNEVKEAFYKTVWETAKK